MFDSVENIFVQGYDATSIVRIITDTDNKKKKKLIKKEKGKNIKFVHSSMSRVYILIIRKPQTSSQIGNVRVIIRTRFLERLIFNFLIKKRTKLCYLQRVQ